MITADDIIKKYTKLPQFVESVYDYGDYLSPVIINVDNVEVPDIGLPLFVNKQTGEEKRELMQGKYKIIINPEREKYRERLNAYSMAKYKVPYNFPSEEE